MVVWLSRFPIHGQVVRPVRHRFRGGCLNSRFSSLFNSVRARTACNLGLHDGVWTRRGTDHGEIRVVKRVSYIRHKSTRATGRNLKTSLPLESFSCSPAEGHRQVILHATGCQRYYVLQSERILDYDIERAAHLLLHSCYIELDEWT
jgi:hypothetical protein